MPSEAARAYPGAYYQLPSVGPAPDNVSPCGTGSNCVDHWMRHCLIHTITLLILIGTKALKGIQQIAKENQHGLALATHLIFHIRKTIHEKSGLADTPTAHPPANSPPLIRTLCEQIAGAVVASLATETILHHNITFQPLPEPGCTRLIQTAITRLSPLHLAGQLHPALAITALQEIAAGATVLIADEHDTTYSLLHQHSHAPHQQPNVTYDHYHCRCGCIHIAVKTTRSVRKGEMLLYTEYAPPATRTLLVQFDGSYTSRAPRKAAQGPQPSLSSTTACSSSSGRPLPSRSALTTSMPRR